MKTIELDDETAERIAKFLPKAITRALMSYQKFAKKDPIGYNATEFYNHHRALKAAAAHLELLFKLTQRLAPSPQAIKAIEDKQNDTTLLSMLMRETEKELRGYHKLPVIDAEFIELEDGDDE